jgi:hypothetical protein
MLERIYRFWDEWPVIVVFSAMTLVVSGMFGVLTFGILLLAGAGSLSLLLSALIVFATVFFVTYYLKFGYFSALGVAFGAQGAMTEALKIPFVVTSIESVLWLLFFAIFLFVSAGLGGPALQQPPQHRSV